jgi:uncharacterized protein (DUF488 family)
MLKRQLILLKFIESAGGSVSRLQLVKLSFLFAHEMKFEKFDSFYQFVPYKYGPFSFGLYHELDGLIDQGFLSSENSYQIVLGQSNQTAKSRLEPALGRAAEYISWKYGNLSNEELIDVVYSRYPWFTINSDKKELRGVKAPQADCAIFTAGYESLQVDGFLNMLLQAGVKKIIDVRRNPISRNYGFHKSTLSGLSKKLHIKYLHIPEAGIPSVWRTDLSSFSDYQRLFERYEQEIIKPEMVSHIADLMLEEPSVLVCMEADPNYCHRTRLAKHINNLTGLDIINLGE